MEPLAKSEERCPCCATGVILMETTGGTNLVCSDCAWVYPYRAFIAALAEFLSGQQGTPVVISKIRK